MDDRIFFVIGDLLANLTIGVLVGIVSILVVSNSWNMWLAMFVMMFLGMIISMIGAYGFLYFFGAMEVMIPAMQTGMWSGMVVGMWEAMMHLTLLQGAIIGGLTGLIVLNIIWIANVALRGSVAIND